jgi:subtilisin-like proprotein convertase family protein
MTLTHTYDADLAIQLISPSGTSIFLSNRRGGEFDNFINTTFSMSASTLISAGSAPFTGSYKPDGNFSSLTGNANGTWQLKVQDLAGTDTGRVQNWSITLTTASPETFTYAWTSNPPGFTSTQQNPVVNPMLTTSYSVLVTSQTTGCLGQGNVTITSLDLNIGASPQNPTCYGTTVQLSSSGVSTSGQVGPVVFTNSTPVIIPDNNATGVTSPIVVSGISPATLTSTSVVSVKLNLTHTYDADLRISLISPSGNTVILSNQRGGSSDNFINTVFTMSAATLIGAGAAPFTGSYVPDGNFNTFTGNANGTWLLKAVDLANIDTGRIQNWSLTINNTIAETFSYSWASSPAGFSSLGQNPTVTPTVPTTYTVTVTSNLTGCVGTKSIIVTTPPQVLISNFSPSNGPPGSVITVNGTGFNTISVVKINSETCSFTIVNDNQMLVTVPPAGVQSGTICLRTPAKCAYCSAANFSIIGAVNLSLKVFIEGLYSGNGQMEPTLYSNAMNGNPNACDSIIVDLHNTTAPYDLVLSATGLLFKNGDANVVLPGDVSNHSYYIAIRHRNSLETWSKVPVSFPPGFAPVNFDFTTP